MERPGEARHREREERSSTVLVAESVASESLPADVPVSHDVVADDPGADVLIPLTSTSTAEGGSRGAGEDTEDAEDTQQMVSRRVGRAHQVGWILIGLQLVVMLVFSTVQYSRFALTADFANYSQAWWAIAHGHLNPFVTGFANNAGGSFWRDNAEFVLYPLSLLYYVDPHPIVLLWAQDLVVVITELVALRWVVVVTAGAKGETARQAGPWMVLGAAVALAVNPWAYATIAFDIHFEPFAALFCVLVGYSLWAGQIRRLWYLVPLALVCHVLAGTYLVGIGLSGMLAGRRSRRPGAVIAVVGLVWFVFFTTIGASGDDGHYVNASYGYLAGPHHGRVGLSGVVFGALRHPGAAVHVAGSHLTVVVIFLVIVGMIGVVSPWGFGMALVVLGPNVLDGSGIFIKFATAFQSWPAMPFILVGSVMMVLRLLEHGRTARRIVVVGVAVWAVLLGELAFAGLPSIPRDWLSVGADSAAEVARVQAVIPPDAEVIATGAVIGRLAERSSIYNFESAGETFPVDRREVVFVFTPHEVLDGGLTPEAADAAVAFVGHRLRARVLGAASGVDAFAWTPPPGTTRVRLP